MPELSATSREIAVLVVDDDEMLLKLMTRQLEGFGFSVTAAPDGLSALERFRQEPHGFDLVLTDQDMPRLDGWGLAWRISDIRPEVPVVLITGNPQDESKALAPVGPFHSLLYKPLGVDELSRSLQSALQARRNPPV